MPESSLKPYSTIVTALNPLPGNSAKTVRRSLRRLKTISLLRRPVLWADPSMTVVPLSSISALSRSFAIPAPTPKTSFAGLAANVFPPASTTKNILALPFPGLLMSVMAAGYVPGAVWKNVFTEHLMLRRSTNSSEANPAPVLLFLKPN